MGGSDQPFIYPTSAPVSQRRAAAYPYSSYNPRASTQAAYHALQNNNSPKQQRNWPMLTFDKPIDSYLVASGDGKDVVYTPAAYEQLQAKKKTQPNQDGKLINFNQHPDSWMIVAEQKVDYQPLPPNTKKKVTVLRWIQFAHRIVVEIAALGLLVCLVTFTNMPNVFSWVMRIAVAWDVIVNVYAIYHLVRPAKSRTAASSASYHAFALIMDFCFLPFYTIMCFSARNNYELNPNSEERWGSLFKTKPVTTDLIWATFLGAAAISGMHLVCCFFDVWLIIVFKKLARLPPDVNPLEDNLTTRPQRASKHKYKNSEVTLTDILSKEKNPAYLSGSTLSVDQQSRVSTANKSVDDVNLHKIPFNHGRITPYSSTTADEKFDDIDLRTQSDPANNERNNADAASSLFSRALAKHASFLETAELVSPVQEQPKLKTSSRPSSQPAIVSGTIATDFAREASPALPNAAPSQAKVVSQQKSGLLTDNWYSVEDDENSTFGTPSRQRTPAFEDSKIKYEEDYLLVPEPLKMNPPTPPPPKGEEYPDPEDDAPNTPQVRSRSALSERRDNGNGALSRQSPVPTKTAIASVVESETEATEKSDVRSSTPKRKYYGDLAAATRGVLGSKKSKPTNEITRVTSNETWKSNGTMDAAALDSTGLSALGGYGYGTRRQKKDAKGRTISRTGADITDSHTMFSSGLRGRRDVSGKVAEEGRGGTWWSRDAYQGT